MANARGSRLARGGQNNAHAKRKAQAAYGDSAHSSFIAWQSTFIRGLCIQAALAPYSRGVSPAGYLRPVLLYILACSKSHKVAVAWGRSSQMNRPAVFSSERALLEGQWEDSNGEVLGARLEAEPLRVHRVARPQLLLYDAAQHVRPGDTASK